MTGRSASRIVRTIPRSSPSLSSYDEDIFECGILVSISLDSVTGRPEGGDESRFPDCIIAMEDDSRG
jgi:hypothetical protein